MDPLAILRLALGKMGNMYSGTFDLELGGLILEIDLLDLYINVFVSIDVKELFRYLGSESNNSFR